MATLFGSEFAVIAATLAGLALTTVAIIRDVGTSRLKPQGTVGAEGSAP